MSYLEKIYSFFLTIVDWKFYRIFSVINNLNYAIVEGGQKSSSRINVLSLTVPGFFWHTSGERGFLQGGIEEFIVIVC